MTKIDSVFLQKWYTRIIGVAFVFVLVSLMNDYMSNGHGPETWHKIFHVVLGAAVLHFGWDNNKFWKPFCLANGAFFLYVGLFGIFFPGFASLDAFGTTDTVLHLLVGTIGLAVGLLSEKKLSADSQSHPF